MAHSLLLISVRVCLADSSVKVVPRRRTVKIVNLILLLIIRDASLHVLMDTIILMECVCLVLVHADRVLVALHMNVLIVYKDIFIMVIDALKTVQMVITKVSNQVHAKYAQ